jgi:hypothetical protein
VRKLSIVAVALALLAAALARPTPVGACDRTQEPGPCGIEHWAMIGSLK